MILSLLPRLRRKIRRLEKALGRWRKKSRRWRSRLRRLQRRDVIYVGVTGSCGKTVGAVLRSGGTCFVGADNDGTRGTLPDLLTVSAETKFCAFELHGSEPGTLRPALSILRPQIGVVTTIGRDHYKNFRSLEATAKEKRTLVESLPLHGTAILNVDDPNIRPMTTRTRARVLTFGRAPDADLRATDVQSVWPDRLSLTVTYGQQRVRVETRLVGEYWITSVLAAIACGIACGLELDACAKAVADFEPVFGRNSVHSLHDGPDYVLDARKAPHWTIAHSLAFVESARAPRKTMVIGTISDYSGGGSDRYRQVARQALQVADRVIFVGPQAGHVSKLRKGDLADRLLEFATSYQAATFLAEAPMARELILIKASGRDHLERIMLAQHGEVMCWKERCGKAYACPDCKNYRQLCPPPFGLAETVFGAEPGARVEMASMGVGKL